MEVDELFEQTRQILAMTQRRPAPVFVGMNFTGNYSLVKDPSVPLPTSWIYPWSAGVKDNRATEASVRGFWKMYRASMGS